MHSFINQKRIRIWASLVSATYLIVFAVWLFNSTGLLDQRRLPIGTDFVAFYSASHAIKSGAPEKVFSPQYFHKLQIKLVGSNIPFFAWHYPPTFLLAVYPLARLPYLAAFFLWVAVSFGLLAFTIRKQYASSLTLPVLFSFPGTFQNFVHGQNGFLSTFCLGTGLCWLNSKPFLAGLAFGLLTYKPHFGLLVIPCLIAGKHWRACAGFFASALTLMATTLALWGSAPWAEFFKNIPTANAILQSGAVNWCKMPTVYAALRLAGFDNGWAAGLQLFAAITTVVLVIRVWKTAYNIFIHGSVLITGTFLVSPFAFDYDLMITSFLITGLATKIKTDFATNKSLILWCLIFWALPFLGPILASISGFNVVPLVFIAFLVQILKHTNTVSESYAK